MASGESAGPEVQPIWSRVERSSHGRRPSLTHGDIAAAAVRVADRDGIDALSMRRVAGDLGVGTMSLYRYVANKTELVDLMVDAVNAELGLPDDVGGWRDVLAEMARSMRRLVTAHPWAAGFGARPSLGPNTLAWIEQTSSRLDRSALTIDQVLDMGGTVSAFVTGFVQYEREQEHAAKTSGLSEEEWRMAIGPYLQDLLATGRYPYLERIVRDAEDYPDLDAVFERRLGYVLDGIGAGLGLGAGRP